MMNTASPQNYYNNFSPSPAPTHRPTATNVSAITTTTTTRDVDVSCEIIRYRNNNESSSNMNRRGILLLIYELFLTIYLNIRDFIYSVIHTIFYFLRRDYHIPMIVLLKRNTSFIADVVSGAADVVGFDINPTFYTSSCCHTSHSMEGKLYQNWLFQTLVSRPLNFAKNVVLWCLRAVFVILDLISTLGKNMKTNFDRRVLKVLGRTPPPPASSSFEAAKLSSPSSFVKNNHSITSSIHGYQLQQQEQILN